MLIAMLGAMTADAGRTIEGAVGEDRRSGSMDSQPDKTISDRTTSAWTGRRRFRKFMWQGQGKGVFGSRSDQKLALRAKMALDCTFCSMNPKPQSHRPIPVGRVILIVLAALCVAGLSFVFDAPVRAAILEAQGKGWKKSGEYAFQAAVSKNGDWPQLMIAGALGLAIASAAGRRDWQRILVAAMIASTLAGILVNASRLTTGRTRPRESPKIEAGWYGPYHKGEILIGNSKFNAFPSGHTATAVGFAVPFLFAKPALGVVLLGIALLIAWSRMALGAHNLSDVIVSILLATWVGWFVERHLRVHGDRYWNQIRSRYTAWRQRRRA